MVSETFDEPALSSARRRVLAALWISLGLHGAVIALVQVAPPAGDAGSATVIEARLVQTQTPAPAAPAPVPVQATPVVTEPPVAAPQAAPPPVQAPPMAPATPPQPAEPEAPAPPVTTAMGGSAAPTDAAPATLTSAVDLTYYSARELDVQPRALRKIDADYPRDAEARGVSGEVRLRVRIEADGRVSNVDIVSVEPAGYAFEEAARAAFRKARFAPAQKNGRSVRAEVLIRFVFDWTEAR